MADTDKNRKEKILESALFDTQAENDNLEKKVQKLEKNARRKKCNPESGDNKEQG